VRQEALVALGAYPTEAVIRHLMQVMVDEGDRWVKLKCESVLLGMPPQALVKGLDRVLAHTTGTVHHKAILMAAEFQQGSEHYFRYLTKGLAAAITDKEKIPYLEALGAFGSADAVPLLLHHLQSPPVVAYVAMASLLKVSPSAEPYVTYLENPNGALMLKQMILRHMIRRPRIDDNHRSRLVTCLLDFLKGDNINMRYLAAQVLIHISGSAAQEAVLDAIAIETDPASLRLLRNSLIEFFTQDPPGYVALLIRRREDPVAFRELGNLLAQIIWSESDVVSQLPRMLAPRLVRNDTRYVDQCVTWLAAQIAQGRLSMEAVLSALATSDGSDDVLVRLARQLAAQPDIHVTVSAEAFRQRMQSGSEASREAMIDLMGVAKNNAVIPVLVSVVCNDHLQRLHPAAVRALGRMTQEEAGT
jgi:hypothetical protein